MEQEVKVEEVSAEKRVVALEIVREDFYNIALNLFEAAKNLKPYDVFYTDVLLGQAQYFLNLSDNPDLLYSVCEMNKQTRSKDAVTNIPKEVQSKIEEYTNSIKEKLSKMKKGSDDSI